MHFTHSIQSKLSFIRGSFGELASFAGGIDYTAIAKDVDGFCSKHVNNVVDFLDKHPGISMALSPQTVIRRCAQNHAERQIASNGSVPTD